MNMIAIDIGNSNITMGLFVNDAERSITSVPGSDMNKLTKLLKDAWQEIPFAKSAKAKIRDGLIVASSVRPEWTRAVADICKTELDVKILLIGKDVPLPIEMGVDNFREVGTDRAVAAAAAFAVVEDAVIVVDFGSAVTIDLVDEEGTFLGGVIAPGFDISAKALKANTAQLPEIKVQRPKNPVGGNTIDAINAGLYYSAIGLLKIIAETYADEIGKWPQMVVTGGAAGVIKDDCGFVDSWVPNLVVRGIVLAYKKYLADEAQFIELEKSEKKK